MEQPRHRFAVCIKNGSYEASLEPRKIYRVLLFPAEMFVPIEVPANAISVFATEASGSR